MTSSANDDGSIEVITAPKNFVAVKEELEKRGLQAGSGGSDHEAGNGES